MSGDDFLSDYDFLSVPKYVADTDGDRRSRLIAPAYLLFAGDTYYPCGGADDLRGVYASIEDARTARAELRGHDWWQIYSIAEQRIVERG